MGLCQKLVRQLRFVPAVLHDYHQRIHSFVPTALCRLIYILCMFSTHSLMLSAVRAHACVLMLLQAESRRLLRGTTTWAQTASLLQGRIPLKGTWEETPGGRTAAMKVRAHPL